MVTRQTKAKITFVLQKEIEKVTQEASAQSLSSSAALKGE